jgi:hypothetical protein
MFLFYLFSEHYERTSNERFQGEILIEDEKESFVERIEKQSLKHK